MSLESAGKIEEFCPGASASNRRSPLSGWPGGKWILSRKIIPLIPRHHCYCEPFLGAGWVLYRKGKSRCEIVNDINGDLINCWKQIRDNAEYLQKQHQIGLFSKRLFLEYRDMTPAEIAGLSPCETAWRLLYLLKVSYGGRGVLHVSRDEAGKGGGRPAYGVNRYIKKYPYSTFGEYLKEAPDRLADVQFDNEPWQKCVAHCDGPRTFFYIDPPYMGYENFYGSRFKASDFQELCDVLKNIEGKFILSLNDIPETRKMFSCFNLHQVISYYSLSHRERNKPNPELLISNFDLDPAQLAKFEIIKL